MVYHREGPATTMLNMKTTQSVDASMATLTGAVLHLSARRSHLRSTDHFRRHSPWNYLVHRFLVCIVIILTSPYVGARKRPPLPPQSEHFQVSRGRPTVDVPLTPHPSSYPPVRQADNYAGVRGPLPPSEISSGRHHSASSREQDLDPGSRNLPNRSRYDAEDTMDVDYPSQTSRSGSVRAEQRPSRPRDDRPPLGLQMDALPKAPRAMSRPYESLSQTPSPSPVIPSMPLRAPEPAPRLQRAPPPHMRQDAPRGPTTPTLPSGPRGDHVESDRRPSRFQDSAPPRVGRSFSPVYEL